MGKACGSGQRKKRQKKKRAVELLWLHWANPNLCPVLVRPHTTHTCISLSLLWFSVLVRLLFHSVSLFWFYFAVIFVWNRGHVERKAVNVTYQSGGGAHSGNASRSNGVIKHSASNLLLFSFIRSALLSDWQRLPVSMHVCVCLCVCVHACGWLDCELKLNFCRQIFLLL